MSSVGVDEFEQIGRLCPFQQHELQIMINLQRKQFLKCFDGVRLTSLFGILYRIIEFRQLASIRL